MQHVDNDMDDLFQRAAENYPLWTGNSDWERIGTQIISKSGQNFPPPGKDKRMIKLLIMFLLFFILPVGWFIVRHYIPSKQRLLVIENKVTKNNYIPLKRVTNSNWEKISSGKENNLNRSAAMIQVTILRKGSIKLHKKFKCG